MAVVMIGIDPHKGTHTAVAIAADETRLGQLRVRASATQVANLRAWAASWPERIWAIEGATGLGRLLAQQLLAAGEQVLDVQPKLAARVRLLNTGTVNKNDPNDARSVAVAAMRSPDIRAVAAEDHASVMKVWVRRHRDLSRTRNRIVCRLHAILCDLVAGGFPKQLSAIQAATVLDGITTVDAVGEARLELAHELLEDLRRVDDQRRAAKRRLAKIVAASGTTVSQVYGAGPVVTATVIGDVGMISRFPTRDHFAAYNGTAPIEASSGKSHHPPAVSTREPAPQPRHPHGRRQPDQPPRHCRPRLLPPQDRRRHGAEVRAARTQTQDQRRHLHPPDRRRSTTESGRPGRANGERLCIQRDRLTPRTGSSEKPLPDRDQL